MRKSARTRTLGQRLFFATLIIGLIIMSAFTAVRGWVVVVQARAQFTEELELEAHAREGAIAEALWSFDRKVLAAELKGVIASVYVSYVSVADDSGTFIEAGERRSEGGFELSVPIIRRDGDSALAIGMLTLQADLDALRETAWDWIFQAIPITALELALVAAILYLYFGRLVTRRLEEDARRLVDFKLDGVDLPFPHAGEGGGSEIDTLESRFNDLTARLRTAYQEAEAARMAAVEAERRNLALFDHSPVALFLEDFSGVRDIVTTVSPGAEKGEAEAFFTARPEFVRQCARKVRLIAHNQAALKLLEAEDIGQLREIHERNAEQGATEIFIAQLSAIARGEKRTFAEGSIVTTRGEHLRVEASWEAVAGETDDVYGRAILALMDVTERVKTQEALRANVKEKEVLIRELFHRTKNNMQSILSLISFQSWKIPDESLRESLHALETRVYSMSLVHRMLYEYNDLSRLSLSAFIREFTAYLSASEDIETRGIRFEQRIEEVEVTVDIAVPFGLIIAELVDNALTHGFPDKKGGAITIELLHLEDGLISLSIADDGVGAPPDFQPDADGMGLQLVKSLAESQLDGQVDFEQPSGGGFRCRIVARPDLYPVRV